MKRLINKIAIVTGASRAKGIGTEICRELAKEGADIFFTHWSNYDRLMNYCNEDNFNWSKHLIEEIRSLGVRCESMELDLSQPGAPRKLLNTVQTKLGSPSILVNNATHSMDVDFRSIDADVLDAHYSVNVRGTCLLTVEFARLIEGKMAGELLIWYQVKISHLSLEIWLMLQQKGLFLHLLNQLLLN